VASYVYSILILGPNKNSIRAGNKHVPAVLYALTVLCREGLPWSMFCRYWRLCWSRS
jgi:hypothetical protein